MKRNASGDENYYAKEIVLLTSKAEIKMEKWKKKIEK
jgi:hypothetical protein